MKEPSTSPTPLSTPLAPATALDRHTDPADPAIASTKEAELGRPLRDFFEGEAALSAEKWLVAYYTGKVRTQGGREDWLFSGSQFERLADIRNPNVFTEKDFVAVSMLGVSVPAHAAIWILGDGRKRLSKLLADIDPDQSITDDEVTDRTLGSGSPAALLWKALVALPNVGPVKASKLLAAKRPALLPVWDQHVGATLGVTIDAFWLPMRHAMILDGPLVQKLVHSSGLDVELLRAVDVVVWMHAHGHKWLRQGAGGKRPTGYRLRT